MIDINELEQAFDEILAGEEGPKRELMAAFRGLPLEFQQGMKRCCRQINYIAEATCVTMELGQKLSLCIYDMGFRMAGDALHHMRRMNDTGDVRPQEQEALNQTLDTYFENLMQVYKETNSNLVWELKRLRLDIEGQSRHQLLGAAILEVMQEGRRG